MSRRGRPVHYFERVLTLEGRLEGRLPWFPLALSFVDGDVTSLVRSQLTKPYALHQVTSRTIQDKKVAAELVTKAAANMSLYRVILK